MSVRPLINQSQGESGQGQKDLVAIHCLKIIAIFRQVAHKSMGQIYMGQL